MARVTVEDCVQKVPNRFELVLLAAQRARNLSRGEELTIDRDNDKNPVVALREIAETKLDQAALKDTLIQGMQKHADIDKPEEVNEMAELEQELAAALAQGGAEAAQPKALPMAEEEAASLPVEGEEMSPEDLEAAIEAELGGRHRP